MILLILFNTFSDVLPAFTCAKSIGNLSSICLGVNIFNPFSCFSYSSLIENVPLPKALRVNSGPS